VPLGQVQSGSDTLVAAVAALDDLSWHERPAVTTMMTDWRMLLPSTHHDSAWPFQHIVISIGNIIVINVAYIMLGPNMINGLQSDTVYQLEALRVHKPALCFKKTVSGIWDSDRNLIFILAPLPCPPKSCQKIMDPYRDPGPDLWFSTTFVYR